METPHMFLRATENGTVEQSEQPDYDTLVLCGGSSKGILTLGSIQCAYDKNVLEHLKYYIGTSSGAIICFFLIIGYTPVEIMVYICTHRLFEKMREFSIVSMIQGNGAISFSNIQEQLEKMTIDKIGYLPTLLDLYEKYGKVLVCITHNITKGNTEYLDYMTCPKLPCLTALHMSANLPFIFENYKYGDSFYIDGGISNNFAIDLGDRIGERVLGVNLYWNSVVDNEDANMQNTLEFIYKLMFIPVQQSVNDKICSASQKCTIINLQYNKSIKFFNFNISPKDKMDMFSIGYSQTNSILSKQ